MVGRQSTLSTGVAWRCRPDEPACGDRYLVLANERGALLAVVDGLGHGSEAAHAAEAAVAALAAAAAHSPLALARACHEALRGTRGAALSLGSYDAEEGSLTWLGIGNVQGVLLHRDESGRPGREFLLLRAGVVGDHLPRLQAAIVPANAGDVLLLATDGLRDRFADDREADGYRLRDPQRLAERLLERHWRGDDDGLVLVARFDHGGGNL